MTVQFLKTGPVNRTLICTIILRSSPGGRSVDQSSADRSVLVDQSSWSTGHHAHHHSGQQPTGHHRPSRRRDSPPLTATPLRSLPCTSPGQNNWGIGRKTQNEFFRGLLAPWGFGEHPKTHTFLESTRPEVNETAIKISNFGRYPQFRRPSNFGPPSGAILTPTCARAWEAHAGCVSKPPGGLWRG